MSFESIVSIGAFAPFSEVATLNSEDVRVIIDRSVDVADASGNVRYVAALVHAMKGTVPDWDPDDVLYADSGDVRLHQVIFDDGQIQKIEASPA